MDFETEKIEFKAQFTEEIYKEVIAFANTDGGFVYVGIDNDGNAVGLSDVDREYTRITNGIRDAIMPDITMFVHYSIQDNNVVRIAVNEGTNKPYYLKDKGLKSSGVYVRRGASSVQASPELIRKMIKESDGDVYEDTRSLEQELTFSAAQTAFTRYGVEWSEDKYRTLGLIDNGIYNNLALLLSDQCRHTTKIAVFRDETCTDFRDSREFGGSIFKQFEDAVTYLSLCNKTSSTIQGLLRTDKKDYPEEAIREALLNALIHRDYSFSGSIIINVNDKKTEFISLGGLIPGLSTEDIKMGISQPRNPKLAAVFHRLRLIECYGTGIRRIFKLYEDCAVQPTIEVSENAFKIVLPNMNEAVAPTGTESAGNVGTKTVSEQMEKVLTYLKANGKMTQEEMKTLLGIQATRAYTLLGEMVGLNLVKVEGRGKNKMIMLPCD